MDLILKSRNAGALLLTASAQLKIAIANWVLLSLLVIKVLTTSNG